MGADPQKDLPWMGPEVLASLDVINAHLFLGNAAPGSEGEQDLFSQFVKIHKRPAARNEFVRKMGCFQRYLVSIDEHHEFEWDADKLRGSRQESWHFGSEALRHLEVVVRGPGWAMGAGGW
mmetsp:Transcript_17781/g.34767  ORF Transcript_17781/g.34767 Transcript_17781/m.34767 type:complete len:121 (+) Transcript_17781:1127-1489(+)